MKLRNFLLTALGVLVVGCGGSDKSVNETSSTIIAKSPVEFPAESAFDLRSLEDGQWSLKSFRTDDSSSKGQAKISISLKDAGKPSSQNDEVVAELKKESNADIQLFISQYPVPLKIESKAGQVNLIQPTLFKVTVSNQANPSYTSEASDSLLFIDGLFSASNRREKGLYSSQVAKGIAQRDGDKLIVFIGLEMGESKSTQKLVFEKSN